MLRVFRFPVDADEFPEQEVSSIDEITKDKSKGKKVSFLNFSSIFGFNFLRLILQNWF